MTGVLEMALAEDALDNTSFIVDAETAMVSVVGRGRFMTGKGWDETFIYRFRGEGGRGRGVWRFERIR